jgi:hypothetical protein
MKTIITHTAPDWDAIGAAWMLQRFLLPDAEIICADRETIEAAKPTAAAIVDCGGELEARRLRFDHHHLPGAEANETCAMLEVSSHIGAPTEHVNPLVLLIYAGDTGRDYFGADYSRQVGLHALLAARKAVGWTDEALIEWGCQELDLLAGRLLRQQQAREELAEKCVWKSDDGKVVAIAHGEPRHSQAAYAAGATLVVFCSDIPTENGTSHAIGISRNQTAEFPHIGDVLAASEIDFATQADKWFRHPAGFFAGRGTGKATRFDTVPDGLSVEHVARAIDAAWKER